MTALVDLEWWAWPILIAATGVVVIAAVFTIIDWRRSTTDERTLDECIADHPTSRETPT